MRCTAEAVRTFICTAAISHTSVPCRPSLWRRFARAALRHVATASAASATPRLIRASACTAVDAAAAVRAGAATAPSNLASQSTSHPGRDAVAPALRSARPAHVAPTQSVYGARSAATSRRWHEERRLWLVLSLARSSTQAKVAMAPRSSPPSSAAGEACVATSSAVRQRAVRQGISGFMPRIFRCSAFATTPT